MPPCDPLTPRDPLTPCPPVTPRRSPAPQAQRWHVGAESFGRSWQAGDVVGCMIDLGESHISFTLNGETLISDGGSEVAFRDFDVGDGQSRPTAAPQVLPHSCCPTTAAPQLLPHSCCPTAAAPQLLPHNCRPITAAPQMLPHCYPITAAP